MPGRGVDACCSADLARGEHGGRGHQHRLWHREDGPRGLQGEGHEQGALQPELLPEKRAVV